MSKKLAAMVVSAILIMQSLPAAAEYERGHDRRGDFDRDRRGDFDRGHRGFVVRRIPAGYRTIHWRDLAFLYYEGLYYRYTPVGYAIVEPPVGIVVPSLPAGYITVTVARTPYYVYGGTYYASALSGYMVVQPPPQTAAVMPAPPAVPAASQPAAEPKEDIDTYEIHIPNDNGSYTLVTLKRTEKGFLGPQGEFYTDHPTVEQLKQRYARK